jgi:hypothetical protein
VSTSDSIWAFELGHRAAEIATRLDVPRIRFAPGPVPSAEAEHAAPARPEPTREQQQQAFALAAAIGDENLRESVQKAVLFSLVRGPGDPSL